LKGKNLLEEWDPYLCGLSLLFYCQEALLRYIHITLKGLNLDRSEWENAQRQNTVSAYVSYMNQFPKGKHFAEALSKMQQLKEKEAKAWDNLRKSDNEAEFHAF